MIYTSNYDNFKDSEYNTYSISWGKGIELGYNDKSYMELAPLKSFWRTWKDNIGKISEEENNKYYIEQYYDLVLSKLDVETVFNDLNNSVLLCYEDNNMFCHRHIVSAWIELLLGEKVREVKLVNNKLVEVRKPDYIKDYLEEIMKTKINMKGFNCLRALYLFEQANELDAKLSEMEDKNYILNDLYFEGRTEACGLRLYADEVEAEYNKNKNIKKRIYQK